MFLHFISGTTRTHWPMIYMYAALCTVQPQCKPCLTLTRPGTCLRVFHLLKIWRETFDVHEDPRRHVTYIFQSHYNAITLSTLRARVSFLCTCACLFGPGLRHCSRIPARLHRGIAHNMTASIRVPIIHVYLLQPSPEDRIVARKEREKKAS